MTMHRFLGQGMMDPTRFGTELIYTIIVVFLCFLVYYKTKDIYDLTKHKGIQYFRNAFMFFGLAYASRFILHLITITSILVFDIFIPKGMLFPLLMIPVGYLSTIAIFYLTYSIVWKKIKYNHFLVFSNLIAVIVSITAFVSRSPIILSLLQLGLLVFALLTTTKKHKKGKKVPHVKTLYSLVSLFWLTNVFVLSPRRFLPFELKIIFQIISIGVFIAIYYKVNKWVK